MWISARTALTLAAAALLLAVVAVAAPLMPRPHLPPLPRPTRAAEKFGAATAALEAPERVRSQAMATVEKVPEGAARWAGRAGSGAAAVPSAETVARLRALLKDARTVADPRADRAEPAWVVRFVRDDHRVDVMVDPAHDRLVVARDGATVGAYDVAALHREFAALDASLRGARP